MSPEPLSAERSAIRAVFAEHFSTWGIVLPIEGPSSEEGVIQDQGWLIQYAFGRDEQGEFLDYYASHRMTNDGHVRLRSDGSQETLRALSTMMFLPKSEEERSQAEREFYRRNREIADELIAKGFNRFTINMSLAVGPDPSPDAPSQD